MDLAQSFKTTCFI